MAARDLSVIRTAPPNRQPIHTEVRVFSEESVERAYDPAGQARQTAAIAASSAASNSATSHDSRVLITVADYGQPFDDARWIRWVVARHR